MGCNHSTKPSHGFAVEEMDIRKDILQFLGMFCASLNMLFQASEVLEEEEREGELLWYVYSLNYAMFGLVATCAKIETPNPIARCPVMSLRPP